jgi:hypothetical protein
MITGGGGGGISIEAIVVASRFSITMRGGGGRGVEGGDGLLLGSGVRTLRSNVEGKGRSISSCGVKERGVLVSLSDETSCPKYSIIFFRITNHSN